MPKVRKIKVEEPSARLRFDEKAKAQPQGFAGLGINEEATIVLKGKITEISQEAANEWSNARKMLNLEITSCEITSPKEAPVTIEAALAGADKTRKKV